MEKNDLPVQSVMQQIKMIMIAMICFKSMQSHSHSRHWLLSPFQPAFSDPYQYSFVVCVVKLPGVDGSREHFQSATLVCRQIQTFLFTLFSPSLECLAGGLFLRGGAVAVYKYQTYISVWAQLYTFLSLNSSNCGR